MCKWYDGKVRGVVCRGKRVVREMEMVGRDLRWTEEGLARGRAGEGGE